MRFILPLVACILATWSLGASAQTYPNKAIQIVVPSTPGGSVDNISRVIGAELATRLGQPVLIVNRAGAGGSLAAESVAKSPADGYTLIMGTVSSFATNVSLREKMRYDPVKDFSPVSLVATQNLIALAKQQPGKLSFASAGVGTGSHLSGELFKMLAQIDMLHVPYKGVAPAMVDVMGTQVSMTFGSIMSSLPHIKDGKLRPLGVTSLTRAPAAGDLPTMNEAGVKDYESETWYGLLAPSGTPPEVVNRLSREVAAILKLPEVARKLEGEGVETKGSTPQEFGRFIQTEIVKWSKVIKAAGIKPE
jgi:tripartite-type tricarboxylate transporter receptor subunit TctC